MSSEVKIVTDRQPPSAFWFRENTMDREIWRCVVEEDEYRIGEIDFKPDDVVIDVGAHIGCFSWWAWQRGSRHVTAFEPDLWNCDLARINLSKSGCRVDVRPAAIVGAFQTCGPLVNPTTYNTGGGDVLNEYRNRLDTETPIFSVELSRLLCHTWSFDTPEIKFLKMDCEGCEFPALLTSCGLVKKIWRIAGEYHELGPGTFHADRKRIPEWAEIHGVPSWTRDVLRDYLVEQGFDVEINHEAENIGKFFAINKRYSPS